ncbi:PDR/VanB family oxidoreductase [Chelatococcus reniformis]|uniref:Ferredoxin--NADP(+) reductase n=1 Tax=Chelatococcus reniformis TaxID=1494448 RepID=A0A916UU95_9HYPH|nr:PDR/VanB family oxidoreductase [Chelatococcus reniformis]GGC87157.1 ferredoxin--NADP(+) reductase [Chelatococcus reniformis]
MSAPSIAVRVSEVAAVTPLVKRFRLEPESGGRLPAFSGGAHIAVEMQDGAHRRRNAFSLMGSPSDTTGYVIGVRRHDNGRGGSRYMHERVTPGTMLRIAHPANLFPIDGRARKHLLLAGGIGITPLVAMAEQFARDGQPFELHYAARSPEHAAFADELLERFGPAVHTHFSAQGRRLACASLLAEQPLGTHLYVCGPETLMDEAFASARALGWPEQSLHRERFAAPARGLPFAVRLARSGRRVDVGADQSMLEALEAAGAPVASLCRGGACGQCETRVLACDGTLLHADHYLSAAERGAGGKVMPCVSRFAGRSLTLDL